MRVQLWSDNRGEAFKCCEYLLQRNARSMSGWMVDSVQSMHLRCHFDRKFMQPYLKAH